jgi:hypothetical protein
MEKCCLLGAATAVFEDRREIDCLKDRFFELPSMLTIIHFFFYIDK